MKHVVLSAIFLALCVSPAALAQTDPASLRRDIMRTMQDDGFNSLHAMTHGKAAYDGESVERAFAVIEAGLDKVTGLWPPNTPSDLKQQYGSSPKAWENKSDFDRKMLEAKQAVETAQPQAQTGLAGLQAAFAIVEQACLGCHETYRIRQR